MSRDMIENKVIEIIYKLTSCRIINLDINLLGYEIDFKPNIMSYIIIEICEEFSLSIKKFINSLKDTTVICIVDNIILINQN